MPMMRSALFSASRWFSKRSLRAQILWLIMGATLAGGLLAGSVSYQRSAHQTLDESRQWAQALASLTVRSARAPLLEQNFATLEQVVREVATMPGVNAIEVVRPGGSKVLAVEKLFDGTLKTSYAQNETTLTPLQTEMLGDERIRILSPFLTSAEPTEKRPPNWQHSGWVSLDFSFAPNMKRARNAWLAGAAITLALVALTLAVVYRFLNRTIHPIRKLAEFSTALIREPGAALRMRWGSQEVRELGRALNWSSTELAHQILQTQKRLSRQRAILDTAADAILGITAEGLIDSANPATERMFGLPSSDIVGKPLAEFLEAMNAAGLSEAMDNGMLIHSTQSRIGRLEINASRHGGTPFPTEVLLGEIPNDPDIRYTCIVRDLSDSKIAEEYLALYGRVLDCTLNGISISDARRYPQPIVHINPAFTRITGYEAHETLGRDATMLEGPLTDPTDLAILARTLQSGGETTITLKNYRKDGSLFHNKLSVSPVKDASGEITHYINVIEDVSGQIEVKQRLIERTARLNATFDLSPDGFAVFDGKGDLITINPALRNMVGDLPSLCSLQRFDQWLQGLCEDPGAYRSILEARESQGKDTLVLVRPTRKVLEREIRQNLGGSGETFFYFRDVTHQYEVDRIKSEFLATAAHELRTPLASILGFTELMIHRKFSDEKRKDLLETVHRQGTLLSNLIQELLDLSRIEARGGKDFHIEPTSLASIVHNAAETIAGRDTTRPLTLEPVTDCLVMADAAKIEQALINLLTNAYKYSPAGGEVRLWVERIERDGKELMAVRVKDHGIGMTPEQVERAFERFYRADGSGNIPGTGLGLNLVKEIAEIHGGAVELSSEHGVGTIATLWLKTAQALEDSAS
jgi:PAS domain S-box-containing protein